jgi:hypothetical protein
VDGDPAFRTVLQEFNRQQASVGEVRTLANPPSAVPSHEWKAGDIVEALADNSGAMKMYEQCTVKEALGGGRYKVRFEGESFDQVVSDPQALGAGRGC